MKCAQIRELLTGFLLGDLDQAGKAAVESHLETCCDCRASARVLETTLGLVRDALAATRNAPVHLAADRRRRVLRARRPRVDFLNWISLPRPALTAAAAIFLVGFIVLAGVSVVFVRGKAARAIYCIGGAVEPYRVPMGRGVPAVEEIEECAVEKDTSDKSYWSDRTVNGTMSRLKTSPGSAKAPGDDNGRDGGIRFNFPDIDDSKIAASVAESLDESGGFAAGRSKPAARAGKMGVGGSGGGGGRTEYEGVRMGGGVDEEAPADSDESVARVAQATKKKMRMTPSEKTDEKHRLPDIVDRPVPPEERPAVRLSLPPPPPPPPPARPPAKGGSGSLGGGAEDTLDAGSAGEKAPVLGDIPLIGGLYGYSSSGSRAESSQEGGEKDEVERTVERSSRVTYKADANRISAGAGRMGAGGWEDGRLPEREVLADANVSGFLRKPVSENAVPASVVIKGLRHDENGKEAGRIRERRAESAAGGDMPGEPEAIDLEDRDGDGIDNLVELKSPERGRGEPVFGNAETGTRRFDEVREVKQEQLSENQKSIRRDFAEADSARERGDYPLAKSLYERIAADKDLDGTPAHGTAQVKVAEVERLTRDYSGASRRLEGLVKSEDPSVKARANYEMARINYDMEEWDESKDHLKEALKIDPTFADARILDGQLNLKRQKMCEATEIRLGLPEAQRVLIPGRPLSFQLEDRNLSVVGASVGMELRVWTSSGDEEVFQIMPSGDSKTRFDGQISTVPGAPVKGDHILQVRADDEVRYDYSERFKEMNKVATLVAPPVTVAPEVEPAPETATGAVFKAAGVNPFVATKANCFSTFSIDVDTASYTLARNYMLRGYLPPAEAVRTEEFVNFFDYSYKPPTDRMFAVYTDCAPTPFGRGLHLLKIGVEGKRLARDQRRRAILTLVIDTSGSMSTPDRLGLLRKSLAMLLDALDPADLVAIVQYDSHARLALDITPVSEKKRIIAVLDGLQTSGSTNLEEGMREGYKLAARRFVPGAMNRVLLLSDGVANLGSTESAQILKQVEEYRKQGIYCSVFGFGIGTYNDEMLASLAAKGDGSYAFIDSEAEAKRVFADEISGTLNVIASDVKIQVEFDPDRVKRWRQLGYEDRLLKKEQFRDDSVDAGEMGSGQSVTALYELELGGDPGAPLGVVRVRYRDAASGRIEEIEKTAGAFDVARGFDAADARFRLAAAVAEFAELLRGSEYAKGSSFADVAAVLRPVALELNLDARIRELLGLAQSASSMPRVSGK